MPRKQTTQYSKETEKEAVSLQLKENWSYSMLLETLGIMSEMGFGGRRANGGRIQGLLQRKMLTI